MKFETKFNVGDIVIILTGDEGKIDTIEYICILDNSEIRYKLHKLDIIVAEKNLCPVEILTDPPIVNNDNTKNKVHDVTRGGSISMCNNIENIYSVIKEIDKEQTSIGNYILKNIIKDKAKKIKDEMIERIDKRLKNQSDDLIKYNYNNEDIRNDYNGLLSAKAKLKKMEIDDFINMSKKEFDKFFSYFLYCDILHI